jgi:large subunit ribosomal protein L15
MKLHTLKPAAGSVKREKRIGRGQGSGHGGTSTRGHKGAKSRSGYSRKAGFEGGQMPLQRRLPKFGFKNPNRVESKAINLDTLQSLADKVGLADITIEVMQDNGLVGRTDKVKILGRGALTSKVNVSVHAISESAKATIESNGGTVTII